MKSIDNDIKSGQLKQVYLLYGEETYLIRQYRDKLKKVMVSDEDNMNFSAFFCGFSYYSYLYSRKSLQTLLV